MVEPLVRHSTPWCDVVLVCRKCGKKLDGAGFGPGRDATLARALRDELRRAGRRREVRVVETKCLSLCPKKAVSVVAARRPGEMLAVAPGAPMRAVLDRLGVL